MKILVTGATGHLGAKVMDHLLAHGSAKHLIASVSDPKKAESLKKKGVDVRHGDFDFTHTLDHAFKGADRMLLISTMGDNQTRIRQHLAAVEAAKLAKVKFIAYTSIAKADKSSLWLGEVHRATEAAITATGIPHCFLRNNWYVENEIASIKAAVEGGPVATCAGEGRVGWAPRADYALAAANVLTGNGHNNKVYELAGSPATYAQFVAALSHVLGRAVQLQNLDDTSFAALLPKSGMPASMVPFVVAIHRAIKEGALDVDSKDLEVLMGRPATPLTGAIEEIIKDMAVPV
ncbi:MAG: SDR family oxidoreductase [Fibrobacteria bacterium]